MMQVFIQAFLARLLPLFPEVTLEAIHRFHPEQYAQAAVPAGLGALLAAPLLYLFGIWLRRMPDKISTAEQKLRVERIRLVAEEWLVWALFFAPSHFGMLLIIAAGFFGTPPWRTAFVLVLAEILWRAAPLLG